MDGKVFRYLFDYLLLARWLGWDFPLSSPFGGVSGSDRMGRSECSYFVVVLFGVM